MVESITQARAYARGFLGLKPPLILIFYKTL